MGCRALFCSGTTVDRFAMLVSPPLQAVRVYLCLYLALSVAECKALRQFIQRRSKLLDHYVNIEESDFIAGPEGFEPYTLRSEVRLTESGPDT